MLRGSERRKFCMRKEAKRGASEEHWGEFEGWADIKFHLTSYGDSALSFK
jgi:hypothetical protein